MFSHLAERLLGLLGLNASEPIAETLPADEGERTVRISFQLAQKCEIGRQLIDLAAGSGPEDAAVEPEEPTAASAGSGENRTLAVPACPGSVSTEGLRLLESWAHSESCTGDSSAEGCTSSRRQWVPTFVVAHAERLHIAATAASFLGCDGFLELYLQLQLLRVAMADGAALEQLARRGQRQGGGGQQLRGRVGDGGDGATEVAVSSLLPKLSSLKKDAISTYLPLLLEQTAVQGNTAVVRASTSGASGTGEAKDTAGPAPGPALPAPLPGPWAPARHEVPVAWVEQLADLLPHTELLKHLAPSQEHLRYLLTAAGIAAVCCVEAQQEQHVQRAKVPYLCLDLGQLPAAVRQQYVAVGVWVEAEGHDQGWSDFSGDHGTYNNSWTWNELVLVVQAGGSGGPTGGGGGGGGGGGHEGGGAGGREAGYKPVREGDPGRLFTNCHASVRWQQHRARLGPTSQVVQDLNTHVFVARGGGEGGGRELAGRAAAGVGEDRRQEEVRAAEEGQDVGLGGGQGGTGAGGTEGPAVAAGTGEPRYQLQLQQCAAFPGWTHFMRSANITLELRARLA